MKEKVIPAQVRPGKRALPMCVVSVWPRVGFWRKQNVRRPEHPLLE